MLSIIDYEKVNPNLLNALNVIHSLESIIISGPTIPETGETMAQLDRYRNEVALEIERQGKRS